MVLNGGSISEYLLTQEIIPRSTNHILDRATLLILTTNLNRILLASIRNLGCCPCPRCRIPLDHAHYFGMARDRSQRVSLARVDDQDRRFNIATARRFIYENKKRVNSAAVERLLKENSLVPSTVCLSVLSWYLHLDGS
jgi:hypothetical protein